MVDAFGSHKRSYRAHFCLNSEDTSRGFVDLSLSGEGPVPGGNLAQRAGEGTGTAPVSHSCVRHGEPRLYPIVGILHPDKNVSSGSIVLSENGREIRTIKKGSAAAVGSVRRVGSVVLRKSRTFPSVAALARPVVTCDVASSRPQRCCARGR